MPHPPYEKRFGRKKIFCLPIDPETSEVLADCEIHIDAVIRFRIPAAAAARFFGDNERTPVQEIFPDLRPEHREILVSGTSPAEWDIRIKGLDAPETEEEFRRRYEPLGYHFNS